MCTRSTTATRARWMHTSPQRSDCSMRTKWMLHTRRKLSTLASSFVFASAVLSASLCRVRHCSITAFDDMFAASASSDDAYSATAGTKNSLRQETGLAT